jgi:hypothetical protein
MAVSQYHSTDESAPVEVSRQGPTEIGAVDGKNVAIEYRWAGDEYDRLRALATELVQRRGRSTCSARVSLGTDHVARRWVCNVVIP